LKTNEAFQDQEPGWSFEQYQNQDASVSRLDSAKASFDLAQPDTALGLINRASQVAEFNATGAKQLTPEEANSKYPDMPTPFREPVNPYVAQMLSDRNQEQQALEKKVLNGPQDVWAKATNFGAGLLAHMMDPVEFGVGMLGGWAVGGVMAKTALGAGLAERAATSAAARLSYNAIEAFSGNALQNTLQEAAQAHVQQGLEGMKYDPVEGMQNVAISTFFGGLLHLGIKEGSFQAARFLKKTSPEADLKATRAILGQQEAGIIPQPEPFARALVKETDVTSADFPHLSSYEYQPATEASMGKKTFYVPAKASGSLDANVALPIGDEHGIGMRMTDDPLKANAAANRSQADSQGVVWEVPGEGLKPLDLTQTTPENAKGATTELLKALGVENEESVQEVLNTWRAKDILSAAWSAVDDGELPKSAISDFQNALKGAGYNSLLDDGSSIGGIEHSPHNVVTLFDEEVKPKGFRAIDPEVRGEPTNAQVRNTLADAESPARQDFTSEESYKEGQQNINDLNKEGVQPFEQDDHDFISEFDALDKQGSLSPEMAQMVEEFKALEGDFNLEDTMLKAVIGCVSGG
jgi:hypothetical protein